MISCNRYGNILPYDETRVVLNLPINECTYINASWLKDIDNKTVFIAAQGPMKQTLPHFLQMIHEQKVKAIVMLTKLDEKKGGEARLHFTGNNKRITSHYKR